MSDTSDVTPTVRGRPAEPPERGRPPATVRAGTEKDPADWTTGDEPMTGPQRSYLTTLAREAGEQVPEELTKAQASELIDRLQASTGRGA